MISLEKVIFTQRKSKDRARAHFEIFSRRRAPLKLQGALGQRLVENQLFRNDCLIFLLSWWKKEPNFSRPFQNSETRTNFFKSLFQNEKVIQLLLCFIANLCYRNHSAWSIFRLDKAPSAISAFDCNQLFKNVDSK